MNTAARERAHAQGSKNVLNDVKVGDEVMKVIWRENRTVEKYVFCRVTKVTEKRVTCGITSYDKDTGVAVVNKGFMAHRVVPVTPEALAWREARAATVAAQNAAQREYDAREDVQLARRIANTDVEKVLSLGLDRLRRIVAIMDETNRSTASTRPACSSCGDTVGVCECM